MTSVRPSHLDLHHFHPSIRDSSQYDYRNSNYDFYDYYNPGANPNSTDTHTDPKSNPHPPANPLSGTATERREYKPYTPTSLSNDNLSISSDELSQRSEYTSPFDNHNSDYDSDLDTLVGRRDDCPPNQPDPHYTPYSAGPTTSGGSATMAPYGSNRGPQFRSDGHNIRAGPGPTNFTLPFNAKPATAHVQPRQLTPKPSRDSGRDSHHNYNHNHTHPLAESPPPLDPSTVSETSSFSSDPINGISNWGRPDFSANNGLSSPSRASVSSYATTPSRRPPSLHYTPEQHVRNSGSGNEMGAFGYSNRHNGQHAGYAPYRSLSSLGVPGGGGSGNVYGVNPSASKRSSRSFGYDDQTSRNSGILDPRTARLEIGIDPDDFHEPPPNNSTGQLPMPARRFSQHPSDASSSRYAAPLLGMNGLPAGASTSSAGLVPDGAEDALSGERGTGPGASPPIGGSSGQFETPPLLPALATPSSGSIANTRGGVGGGGGGGDSPKEETSDFLREHEAAKRKNRKWWIFGLITLILLAIGGGIAGGIVSSMKKGGGSPSAGNTASDDLDKNGDLNKNSAEIKALMNNPNLHKVFPGIDYTPLHAQYPDCLTHRPSQNNVTRDMAVLAQMTNRLRLYGNDCNQTEMVLHAIDRLDLKPKGGSGMHVWLGVWLDKNDTTNDRQMKKMWSLLDEYGPDPFDGVVVGNEVLFRKDFTATELEKTLKDVRDGLDKRGYSKLRLATSDLGSAWTKALTKSVDVIMANIHPFFGGVTAAKSTEWTWTFWQNNDVPLTAGDPNKHHVISEVGWPSAGGNNCGPGVKCSSKTSGSVAGIDEMNDFMDGWVCNSLKNGTDYFWFEAFDEPWKVMFNTDDEQWEDKWGLMDVNRKLKPGVKIPSCGGKTVDGMRFG